MYWGYDEWRARALGKFPEFPDIEPHSARAVCKDVLDRRGNGLLSTEETRLVLQAMRLPVLWRRNFRAEHTSSRCADCRPQVGRRQFRYRIKRLK